MAGLRPIKKVRVLEHPELVIIKKMTGAYILLIAFISTIIIIWCTKNGFILEETPVCGIQA
ncbi:hypothetical protein ASG35_20695 [Burkholderia sp. Leaf177]|nr:hypothetical protein ASG35_20695 [Burkholderia sp. Leaf177]